MIVNFAFVSRKSCVRYTLAWWNGNTTTPTSKTSATTHEQVSFDCRCPEQCSWVIILFSYFFFFLVHCFALSIFIAPNHIMLAAKGNGATNNRQNDMLSRRNWKTIGKERRTWDTSRERFWRRIFIWCIFSAVTQFFLLSVLWGSDFCIWRTFNACTASSILVLAYLHFNSFSVSLSSFSHGIRV